MPFYTGKTKDGSDMKEHPGFYVSPDGKEFSNFPYSLTKEQRLYWSCFEYVSDNIRSFKDEYDLILEKKSTLSKSQRDYIINLIEKELDLK